MTDLSGLAEAYYFYQRVRNDKEATRCGCYNDAVEWIFDELEKLFNAPLAEEKQEVKNA